MSHDRGGCRILGLVCLRERGHPIDSKQFDRRGLIVHQTVEDHEDERSVKNIVDKLERSLIESLNGRQDGESDGGMLLIDRPFDRPVEAQHCGERIGGMGLGMCDKAEEHGVEAKAVDRPLERRIVGQ